jgi:putative Mn2+ efflux pump MntP
LRTHSMRSAFSFSCVASASSLLIGEKRLRWRDKNSRLSGGQVAVTIGLFEDVRVLVKYLSKIHKLLY